MADHVNTGQGMREGVPVCSESRAHQAMRRSLKRREIPSSTSLWESETDGRTWKCHFLSTALFTLNKTKAGKTQSPNRNLARPHRVRAGEGGRGPASSSPQQAAARALDALPRRAWKPLFRLLERGPSDVRSCSHRQTACPQQKNRSSTASSQLRADFWNLRRRRKKKASGN